MASDSCFTIASPSPVPPNRRVVEASACVNCVNSRGSTSAGIPMPESCTASCTNAVSPDPFEALRLDEYVAATGELECVAGEVEQDLPHAALVAQEARRRASGA